MAKFDSSENLIAKKVVIGDQVGEETRGAKFGADPYTAASGGLKLQCELLRKKFFFAADLYQMHVITVISSTGLLIVQLSVKITEHVINRFFMKLLERQICM